MSERVDFIYLNAEEVIACGGGDLKATISSCENAFRLFEVGECKELPCGKIAWNGDHARRAGPKSAFVGGDVNAVATKWIPANPDNPKERGLPRAIAQIILTDPISALPRAIMDGTVISAVRTAAVGGIFAKYLASSESPILSVIGTGPIGRLQLRAIREVREDIERVQIYDLFKENSEAFASTMKEEFPEISFEVCSSAQESIEGADIISTATVTAPEDDYIEDKWLKPGSLVINTSSNDTKMDTLRRVERLVFSFSKEKPGNKLRSDCQRAYDEGILPSDKLIHISEVITGKEPPRLEEKDRIVALAMGMAIMDVINAQRVYESALEKGLGTELPLWEKIPWV